jgi:hypothetical protein
MAQGTINGSTGNEYIDAKVVWSSTTNALKNQSSVTAALYYKRNNTGYTTYGTGSFSITINGVKTSATKTLTITESEWVKAVSATVTVSHNDNGSKSIAISATGSISGTSLDSTSVSGTAVLDTIPRATSIDSLSCSTKYFNGTFTYKYTPKNSSYYNRCNISLNIDGTYTNVRSVNLGKKSASQKTETVTFSEDELATIYNKLPKTTKGTLRFTFRTYSDSEYSSQIGDPDYKEITLTIPNIDATQPTATMTLSPVSSLPSPFNTLYIKGRSKIDANFTNAEGKYGASIVSYTMSVLGKNYGSPYTSEYLNTEGEVSVTGTIKDSRGYSRTYTKKITVIAYSNPKIIPASGDDEIICARCDANGNFNDSGTYLRIKAKRSYSKVLSSGVQKNFCSIRYRYKAEGGSYSSWATILATNSASDEIDTGALLNGDLLQTNSYVVQAGVIDTLGESDHTTVRIPTDKVYWHRAGSIRSYGVGKYAEEPNTLDVAEDITAKFRGKVSFLGEEWVSLPLGTNVSASSVNTGRWGGSGVYYRVCAGEKHIYVAFNISFTTSGSAVRAESHTIPYPPSYDVYALCAVGFADDSIGIAKVGISPKGRVNIYPVYKLPGATLSTGDTVKWIDGYIDYWT